MGSKILIPFSWLHFGAEFLIVLIGYNSRLVIGHISWLMIGHNRWPISDEQCNFDPLLFCCKIKRCAQPWIHSGILILTLTRADVGFELSLISQSEQICWGQNWRKKKTAKEDIGVVRVLLITHREYFYNQTNSQITTHLMILIISLIWTPYLVFLYFTSFMATPERDKEGFILVDRKRQKKRKAEHSPLLHTPPGSSSASSSGSPTRSKPSSFNFPNTVPIIIHIS